jgi:hypothetical protein
MNLLSVGVARSVWLFDLNEMNAMGKSIFPDIFLWLGEKYSFQTFPKSIADLDKETKGYVFKTGKFQTDEGSFAVNLSFFNDGLVAESWASTEKTDAFLEDALRSAAVKYGLVYHPELIRSKQYVSELNVRLDYPLTNLNAKIAGFCQSMTSVFKKHNLRDFDLTGMSFGPDASATAYKPPHFTIERKMGVPFSERRFWSKSPFTTTYHLRILGEFEQMLAAS